ncbi:unnamed protein product [Closterium sp. NIES-53]
MSVILARITHPTPPPFAKSGLSRRVATPAFSTTTHASSIIAQATQLVHGQSSAQSGEWEQLHADATEAVNTPQPPRHQPDDAGTVSRAEGLAKRGSLRRAVLALESTPVCTPCPAILHQLREKHPPADNEELTWPRTSTPNLTITHADFVKLLSRCENGVGAGPSGTTFDSPPLSSERGVRQGDPLGPLLFAAGIHPALRETAAAHPEVLCLAYADDVTFIGEQEHTVAAFTFFTDKLAHLGLAHNPEKCAAWSSATVETSQLPPGVPFSKEGVRLLGSYLGPATGAANFLAGQLEEMAKPLPLLERADPQVSSLLLTRCISRRVAYITRTTPLNLLPRNTWSQWGRDLLATLLTSCGIRVP